MAHVPPFEMPRSEIQERARPHPASVPHRDRPRQEPLQHRLDRPDRAFVSRQGDHPDRHRALVRARRDGDAALREHRRAPDRANVPRRRREGRLAAGRLREGPRPASACGRPSSPTTRSWSSATRTTAAPRAFWRPPSRSWPSPCSASITATRSASRPGSPWRNGPEGITKKAVVCSLAYRESDARLRPLWWV